MIISVEMCTELLVELFFAHTRDHARILLIQESNEITRFMNMLNVRLQPNQRNCTEAMVELWMGIQECYIS